MKRRGNYLLNGHAGPLQPRRTDHRPHDEGQRLRVATCEEPRPWTNLHILDLQAFEEPTRTIIAHTQIYLAPSLQTHTHRHRLTRTQHTHRDTDISRPISTDTHIDTDARAHNIHTHTHTRVCVLCVCHSVTVCVCVYLSGKTRVLHTHRYLLSPGPLRLLGVGGDPVALLRLTSCGVNDILLPLEAAHQIRALRQYVCVCVCVCVV